MAVCCIAFARSRPPPRMRRVTTPSPLSLPLPPSPGTWRLVEAKFLASGSLDKTLKLWDLTQVGSRAGHKCRHTFQGHKDFVLSVVFAPSRTLDDPLCEGVFWPGQGCSGCGEVYAPARWEKVLECERTVEQGVRKLQACGAGAAEGGVALMQLVAGCFGESHWGLQELRWLRADGLMIEANTVSPVRSHAKLEMEAF